MERRKLVIVFAAMRDDKEPRFIERPLPNDVRGYNAIRTYARASVAPSGYELLGVRDDNDWEYVT